MLQPKVAWVYLKAIFSEYLDSRCRKSHFEFLTRGFVFACYQTQFITSIRIHIVKHEVHTLHLSWTDLASINILHIHLCMYVCHIFHFIFVVCLIKLNRESHLEHNKSNRIQELLYFIFLCVSWFNVNQLTHTPKHTALIPKYMSCHVILRLSVSQG